MNQTPLNQRPAAALPAVDADPSWEPQSAPNAPQRRIGGVNLHSDHRRRAIASQKFRVPDTHEPRRIVCGECWGDGGSPSPQTIAINRLHHVMLGLPLVRFERCPVCGGSGRVLA